MVTCGQSCRPCDDVPDVASDTVRIRPSMVTREKDNFARELREQREKKAKEEEERADEQRRRAQVAMEEATRRHEQERQRLEEEARVRAEEEQREKERQAEEERRLLEEQMAEEERLLEVAKQQRVAAERKRIQGERRLDEFLLQHNFLKVNEKKSKWLKYTYPLHVAVDENDGEVVRLLLAAGANRSVKDSSGLTPLQLAQKKARRLGISRVFDDVLLALRY